MIVKNINIFQKADPQKIDLEMPANIENILMCAGMLHDLGNPPFGHFGEVVIGEWFETYLTNEAFSFRGEPVSSRLSEQKGKDLIHFEGNAQTIRILTKLDYLRFLLVTDFISGMTDTYAKDLYQALQGID